MWGNDVMAMPDGGHRSVSHSQLAPSCGRSPTYSPPPEWPAKRPSPPHHRHLDQAGTKALNRASQVVPQALQDRDGDRERHLWERLTALRRKEAEPRVAPPSAMPPGSSGRPAQAAEGHVGPKLGRAKQLLDERRKEVRVRRALARTAGRSVPVGASTDPPSPTGVTAQALAVASAEPLQPFKRCDFTEMGNGRQRTEAEVGSFGTRPSSCHLRSDDSDADRGPSYPEDIGVHHRHLKRRRSLSSGDSVPRPELQRVNGRSTWVPVAAAQHDSVTQGIPTLNPRLVAVDEGARQRPQRQEEDFPGTNREVNSAIPSPVPSPPNPRVQLHAPADREGRFIHSPGMSQHELSPPPLPVDVEDDKGRCCNCGSSTHVFRHCVRPLICAYCCTPGHTFRTCDDRQRDERLGKPIPREDALLDWAQRSHEEDSPAGEGPLAACGAVGPPSESPPRPRAASPAGSAPPLGSGEDDMNRVMAAAAEARRRRKRARSRKRRRSRSSREGSKADKKKIHKPKGTDGTLETELPLLVNPLALAAQTPPTSAPPVPTILMASSLVLPPNAVPAADLHAQLQRQLQSLIEKQQAMLSDRTLPRGQQISSLKDEEGTYGADSLNEFLSSSGQGQKKDDSLDTWLQACARPAEEDGPWVVAPGRKKAAAPPEGRKHSGQGTPGQPEDLYDIFADTDTVPDAAQAGGGLGQAAQAEDAKDAEGYFCPRIGEMLNGRYRVQGVLGRGVFGVVLSAVDARPQPEGSSAAPVQVAIKVARDNAVMEAAARKEVAIIQALSNECPQERSKCVAVMETFVHQRHFCIVMELLHVNLRQLLKKYGMEEGVPVGLHVDAVRRYSRDLLQALRCLQRSGIFHGDVKPDNVLVNQRLQGVRLCDFGTACDVSDCTPTPYVCSRYYRAPEVILGLTYGPPADIWAAACTIAELYMGRVLFPGESNNEMLHLFMALRGRFPQRMLKAGQFVSRHFDEDFAFLHTSLDPVSQKSVTKKVVQPPSAMGLKALFRGDLCRAPDEKAKVHELADLLDRLLQLDPASRLTPHEALQHSFFALNHT